MLYSGMVRIQIWQSQQETPRKPSHTDIPQTPRKDTQDDVNICFGAKWDYSQDVFVYHRG